MFQRTPNAAQRCFYESIGPCVDGENGFRDCALWGRLWRVILYLEMPGQVGRTHGSGKYCRYVSKWILWIWNGEIPCIIGTTG